MALGRFAQGLQVYTPEDVQLRFLPLDCAQASAGSRPHLC
jgi:hypothetical protein